MSSADGRSCAVSQVLACSKQCDAEQGRVPFHTTRCMNGSSQVQAWPHAAGKGGMPGMPDFGGGELHTPGLPCSKTMCCPARSCKKFCYLHCIGAALRHALRQGSFPFAVQQGIARGVATCTA